MKSWRLLAFPILVTAAAALAPSGPALAIWPPPVSATPADLSRPENWPNDPDFARPDGSGGQWYWWSWTPQATLMFPGFRQAEAMMGVGNHVDGAWAYSIGDPRILIAVLDSGIQWDNDDLANKIALNTAELPMPMGATAYDANGDGVVNARDYLNDPRVTCGTAMPRNQYACRGADGMPNDPNRNGIFDPGDLIRTFSDHTDADHNGYEDDIAGWDFFKGDNDPYDDTRFGHGTGEARDSGAEGNNGRGGIGSCPRCMIVPTRVGDSFITDVNLFGQGVVYAVDRGASVVQEALGTVDNSRFAQAAIDYAYAHDVVVMASAADENSRHHNVPGTNNHTVYAHAIRYDGEAITRSTTFLNFNNCTNYGAQLVLSVAATSCSSAAVGYSSGMAGLLYAQALQSHLTPGLSAEEVKQLLTMTTDDVNVPESQASSPMYDPTKYPSLPGWDQRFGYGRTNARRAVEWVHDGKIPPEIDIVSPRWFTVFDPDRPAQRTLQIEGRIAARRAPRFDYTIEWATGVEPADSAWHMVRSETNVTAAVTDRLGEIDLSTVQIDNPGEVENRYTFTVRIRAVAHYDGAAGDVRGETRRAFYVHRDPTVLPGFPVNVHASGESSAHLADLNRDGASEIVIGTSDGEVHAIQRDGTELAGWPARTGPMRGMSATRTPSYLGSAGYQTPAGMTAPGIDPTLARDPVLSTVGVGDLDGDGAPEVVAAGYHGTVYVFRANGTPYEHGFPFELPDVPSAMTSPTAILDRGIFGAMVLSDLDGDRTPEIVFGAFDGKLYALDVTNGHVKDGFPVEIHFPEAMAEHNRIFGSVGIGDFDGDHRPDIAVVSSERLPGDNNVGAVYLVYGDGNRHAGGAFHPHWPVPFTSFNFFPLVGEGLSSSPPIADLDGDGRDELALTGTASGAIVLARGEQPMLPRRPTPAQLANTGLLGSSGRGPLSNLVDVSLVSFISAFSLGTFGDMTNDGVADYVITGADLDLGINLAGGGRARNFHHLVGAYNGRTARILPGFPRVIEDYTFFHNPTVADLNGDGYAEAIIGTAGYYVQAFDGCGRSPTGWPKFTGQWIIPAPAVGDLGGDGHMQVVTGTRSGYLWAWNTDANSHTASVQWSSYRHDNANTGNYGTALGIGVRHVEGVAPLECPLGDDDAGVPDAGVTDGGARADASTGATSAGGGCGCTVPTTSRAGGLWSIAAAVAAVTARRRRRASRR